VNIIVVTSSHNPFDGVFWSAYMAADGPPPTAVFFLGDGKRVSYSFWQSLLEPLFIFSLGEAIRLMSSAYLGLPLNPKDRKLCMHVDGKTVLESISSYSYHYGSLRQDDAFFAFQDKLPGLLVSVGSPEIFRRSILEVPEIGAINIHNGRIPHYRGHFGTFWEVYNGEIWGYVCIHEMLPKVDAGKVIAFDKVRISDFSSFLDLMIEKKRLGGVLLAQIVREIQEQGTLPETEIKFNETSVSEAYYDWPSLAELLKFRQIVRKMRHIG
jgi:folate-dependent phosphoribosylglycinamide formyltransferase PurN